MIDIMASERMSYKIRSFDMAHYSHFLIPLKDYGNNLNPTCFYSIALLIDDFFFLVSCYIFLGSYVAFAQGLRITIRRNFYIAGGRTLKSLLRAME